VGIEFLVTSLIVVVSPAPAFSIRWRPVCRADRGRASSPLWDARLHRPAHGRGDHGLAALLHTSALAFQTLKYLGVAYLLYMAWNALRERGALRVEKESAGARHLK